MVEAGRRLSIYRNKMKMAHDPTRMRKINAIHVFVLTGKARFSCQNNDINKIDFMLIDPSYQTIGHPDIKSAISFTG